MHLINGSLVFAAVYVYAVYRIVPGEPWVKGTTWGLVLWAISQTVVMPVMGAGLFSAKAGGPMAVMASLVAHAAYGALLGGVAGAAEATPACARIQATR